jgi:hypothetical protein
MRVAKRELSLLFGSSAYLTDINEDKKELSHHGSKVAFRHLRAAQN